MVPGKRHGKKRKGCILIAKRADGYQVNSLCHIPENVDEEALIMLSDILPAAFECGVLNGQIKPGDTVAIVGAGPVDVAIEAVGIPATFELCESIIAPGAYIANVGVHIPDKLRVPVK